MMEVLQLEFMQRALIAGLLVSVACGVIGTYVVVNRIVFISGAIAHAAYGGIGLGYYLGANPVLGAILFSVGAALAMGVAKRRTHDRADTV
ncbi:MAG TPA: metal ABC transporter permease, partial [Anaerolineae bacterium]|nr:metal ABC transporter permease [Anaerolineae bacterium]